MLARLRFGLPLPLLSVKRFGHAARGADARCTSSAGTTRGTQAARQAAARATYKLTSLATCAAQHSATCCSGWRPLFGGVALCGFGRSSRCRGAGERLGRYSAGTGVGAYRACLYTSFLNGGITVLPCFFMPGCVFLRRLLAPCRAFPPFSPSFRPRAGRLSRLAALRFRCAAFCPAGGAERHAGWLRRSAALPGGRLVPGVTRVHCLGAALLAMESSAADKHSP